MERRLSSRRNKQHLPAAVSSGSAQTQIEMPYGEGCGDRHVEGVLGADVYKRQSEACQSHRERYPEQEREIAGGLIYPDACRGSDGHGQIIAQAVEAHPLVAARGGERVDGGCGVGHGGGDVYKRQGRW